MIKKGDFTLILGPCLIENLDHGIRHASFIKKTADKFGVKVIYKSSFLKDNRTSVDSPRGPGILPGLNILQLIRTILPTCTDIHSAEHASRARKEALDLIQIPAMLSRQTSLLEAAGAAGIQVMLKKMTTMNPQAAFDAVEKVGRSDTVICERGTFFGGREVVDMESVAHLVASRYPVVVDVTHPATSPAMAWPLAKASCALGVDGIFAEFHENPEVAPSDGKRMLPLKSLERFIEMCLNGRAR